MWFRQHVEPSSAAPESVSRVLDPATRAIHLGCPPARRLHRFQALACQLGLDSTETKTRVLSSALVAVTLLAVAAVLLHATRRYQQRRERRFAEFRVALTLGLDALAALAIVFQLFPILLAPLCR